MIPPNSILTSEGNMLRHGGPLQFGNTGQCAGIFTALDSTLASRSTVTLGSTLLSTMQLSNFAEVVLADIKPITVNKLDIRNKKKKKKTEGIWLGKTTNSGEHIIATMDETGKAFYTRSLTRLTPELQWDKK
eukprot:3462341-Amphidinium_carterae.1